MKKPFRSIAPILFLALSLSHVIAQPKPTILCTEVVVNGIIITWKEEDPGLFDSYVLERSIDGITFTEIANLSPSEYNFLDQLVSTDAVVYYRLSTLSGANQSEYSDIFSNIVLDVEQGIFNTVARLKWNSISQNAPGEYKIYRQSKGEEPLWQLLHTTHVTYASDTITYPYCYDTLMRYKVDFFTSGSSCISQSTIDSTILSDQIGPGVDNDSSIMMDTVSIDLFGNTYISWAPYRVGDIESYIIYRLDKTGIFQIDAVPGNQLYYILNPTGSTQEKVSYRVAAKDTCHPVSPVGEPWFNTIYIEPIHWNYCDTEINLKWDPVLWLDPDLFAIYTVDTATIPFNTKMIGQTSQQNYIYETGFQPDSTYCYYVRAHNSNTGKSSQSNIRCFTVDRPEQPDTLNLKIASVDTTFKDRMNIIVLIDTKPADTKCILLRKVNLDDPWEEISSRDVSSHLPNQDTLFFTDHTAQVNQHTYYYKAIIQDGCGHEAWFDTNDDGLMDTIGVRTIFLQGMANDQLNHLYWNRYLSSVAEVAGYRLIRKVDGVVDTIIDVGQDTLYDDYIYDLGAGSGRFSYLAEARIVDKNAVGPDTLSSFSNEIAQARAALLYMPTGFTPNGDGMNDYFSPRNSFSDDQADFIFLIYNRWGQKIYESTTSSDPGWDGTINDIPAPDGVYVYFIRYVSTEGEIYEKKGTVTLLR